ncbi:hypothetical protein [Streptomyces sp. CC208A]|uniref:hypothetical protein n=1 Tax=Streptomyces sp. CC208A TaxID=3044573 RepID=UPI0024A92A47|nr:hypothetical protein [Streptomyces sp. CC208A]
MGSWRSKPWLLWALLMVPAAATIAGIGTYTRVLGPEDPPRPGREDLVGRYEDGHGGAVTLKADGTAVLSGVEYVKDDGPGEVVMDRCEDRDANWSFNESRPRWSHVVSIGTACGGGMNWIQWDVIGSPSAPEIVYYVGGVGYAGDQRVFTRR